MSYLVNLKKIMSEVVVSKCMPVFIYGIEVSHFIVNLTQFASRDFEINHFFREKCLTPTILKPSTLVKNIFLFNYDAQARKNVKPNLNFINKSAQSNLGTGPRRGSCARRWLA